MAHIQRVLILASLLVGCGGGCSRDENAGETSAGGGGGMATTPAASSSSSSGGAGTLGPGWPDDDDIWEPVPGAPPECDFERVSEGFLPRLPPRDVADCGVGCRALQLTRPGLFDLTTHNQVGGGAIDDGSVFVTVNVTHGEHWIREVFDVETGAARLVMRHAKDCYAATFPDDPGLLGYMRPDASAGAGMLWMGESLRSAERWFGWSDGSVFFNSYHLDGVGFTAGVTANTQPFVRQDPADDFVPLDAPNTYALNPAARGDLFVWNEWSTGRGRLRHWRKDAGLQPAFTPPDDHDVTRVALSDQRVVWIEASGTDTLSGSWSSARLAWSAVSEAPTNGRTASSIGLPLGDLTTDKLKTYGDYAATALQCPPYDGPICAFVLFMGSDEAYLIERPTDWWIAQAVAAGQSSLVFRATRPGELSDLTERLLVYDPSAIPTAATPWP